jgi:uncharacterized protein YndB with AHSA1/START domain
MAAKSYRNKSTRVSRIIKAPRRAIYRAFLDRDAMLSWLPPKGMKGQMHEFDAREGGGYRMSLTYLEPGHSQRGKTSAHTDIARVRFVEMIRDERIVEQVEFESKDPAFSAPMTLTWTLADDPRGTEVTVSCENAPEGIAPADHEAGIRSSLENLAAFTE